LQQRSFGAGLLVGKVKIEVETAYVVPKPTNSEVVATGLVPISAPLFFTANDCLDISIARF
jgi:hypothetical protein